MSKSAIPVTLAHPSWCLCIAMTVLPTNCCVLAHEDHSHMQWVTVDASPSPNQASESPDSNRIKEDRIRLDGPSVEAFRAFAENVSARVDGKFLVVESNSLPDHGMMIGIRAWQQQVPLPQPFHGENAWRLPLRPQPAADPISVLAEPLRGAIALAVNGVPIFCALNNRGEDTYLAGELDRWGGHCGRGDDYHYHIAPMHLQDQVGEGNPIAFALDGYPILGLTDADGSTPSDLDPFNGHSHDGSYHYHATKGFPYINGGLHGVVIMDGGQVRQPKDSPVRPGLPPLRGAMITDFTRSENRFDLEYDVSGRKAHVKYEILSDDKVRFTYVNASGESSTEVFQRGRREAGALGIRLWWFIPIAIALVSFWSVLRRKTDRQKMQMKSDASGNAILSE